ncbi:hypothetical protein AB9M62_07175 [Bacillales bacterium AN1005]
MLSPDFTFEQGNQKNLGITVIGRLFCHVVASVNVFYAINTEVTDDITEEDESDE